MNRKIILKTFYFRVIFANCCNLQFNVNAVMLWLWMSLMLVYLLSIKISFIFIANALH